MSLFQIAGDAITLESAQVEEPVGGTCTEFKIPGQHQGEDVRAELQLADVKQLNISIMPSLI